MKVVCFQVPGEKEEKPKDLPPVKEKEVPMSDKDPKNNSGCVISWSWVLCKTYVL